MNCVCAYENHVQKKRKKNLYIFHSESSRLDRVSFKWLVELSQGAPRVILPRLRASLMLRSSWHKYLLEPIVWKTEQFTSKKSWLKTILPRGIRCKGLKKMKIYSFGESCWGNTVEELSYMLQGVRWRCGFLNVKIIHTLVSNNMFNVTCFMF